MARGGWRERAVNYNTEFFSSWSSELAYFVGLFASDGNLYKQKGRPRSFIVSIELQERDREILEKLHQMMGLNSKLGRRDACVDKNGVRHQAQVKLAFNSEKVALWLKSLGLHERKSLRMGPIKIPDEYFSEFARGVLDGDGCYGLTGYPTKRSPLTKKHLKIDVLGSEMFLKWFSGKVSALTGICSGRVFSHGTVSKVSFSAVPARRLRDWMYLGATLFISRKREMAYREA